MNYILDTYSDFSCARFIPYKHTYGHHSPFVHILLRTLSKLHNLASIGVALTPATIYPASLGKSPNTYLVGTKTLVRPCRGAVVYEPSDLHCLWCVGGLDDRQPGQLDGLVVCRRIGNPRRIGISIWFCTIGGLYPSSIQNVGLGTTLC